MRQFHDAIIVGGGPAGASCAIWLARLGLAPLLIDAGAQLGGLGNDNPFRDDWIAVLPGVTGREVAANIAQSVAAAQVPTLAGYRTLSARRESEGFRVESTPHAGDEQGGHPVGGVDGPAWETGQQAGGEAGPGGEDARSVVYGRYLVIATGVRARNLPGAAPARRWPGVLVGPGSAIVAQQYEGLSVAILGGGDNAFENYAYVRERGAREVHLYARSVRARPQLVAAAATADLHLGAFAVEPDSRCVNGRKYDLILVFYGWEPQAGFAESLALQRDARGYIQTDFATAATSATGVYAIGEVANRMHPCVVTSMADGVVAAKAIQAMLERGARAASPTLVSPQR